jgi:YD repeat-containing protein
MLRTVIGLQQLQRLFIGAFIFILWAGLGDNAHAAKIEIESYPVWVLLGGGDQFASFDELVGYYNGKAETQYNDCLQSHTNPPFACTRLIFTGKYPAQQQKINGDYWWWILPAELTYYGVDGNYNVHTYTESLDSHYGANVYYFCPKSWLSHQKTVADGLLRSCSKYIEDRPTCPAPGAANAGASGPSASVLNPVNASSGDKHQHEVDFVSDDGLLRAERTYVNQYEGWIFDSVPRLADMTGRSTVRTCFSGIANYRVDDVEIPKAYCNAYISPSGLNNEVDVILNNGNRIRFIETSSGVFLPESPGQSSELMLVDPAMNNGALWRLKLANDASIYYGNDGRARKMATRAGRSIIYRYLDGQLASKSDDRGRTLSYEYDAWARIAAVVLPDGRRLRYTYQGPFLNQVTWHDGVSRRYLYNEAGLVDPASPALYALTGIIDENDNRYSTWSYDVQGRAISSSHADGMDAGTLTYNANGTTTVTYALGKKTTYHFTTINGAKKIVRVEGHQSEDCAGTNQSYTYDPNGFLASKTDWNNVTTTFVHDARGRELSRTEAAGTPDARTITTEWHSQWYLPVRITEPGRVTTLTYDEKGRLLSRNETAAP